MLSSLLIITSIWGFDPDNVFAREGAAFTQSEIANDEFLTQPTPKSQLRQSTVNGIFSDEFTARGQSVSEGTQLPDSAVDFAPILNDAMVQRLIDEMNPFVPLTFPVLMNYYDPFGIQMGTGSNGRQGYRLGWSTYTASSVLPEAHAIGTTGGMQFVEWDSNAKYSQVVQPGLLFNGTFWFNAHWWDGPSGIGLPPQVDQTSSDLELAFFNDGPWSGQIAFHPQIVESYGGRLDRNAFNFDGRAVATYQASPEWSFVGGIGVWDRVNTLVIPHVGAIWTPTNRLEIRALFPRSRVSYFLGNRKGADFWVYGQYEYCAEAWQTTISGPTDYSDRMQITDQRLTAGIRCDSGRYTFFTEGGYVFDRQVKFAGSTPSFGLADCAIISVGVRY